MYYIKENSPYFCKKNVKKKKKNGKSSFFFFPQNCSHCHFYVTTLSLLHLFVVLFNYNFQKTKRGEKKGSQKSYVYVMMIRKPKMETGEGVEGRPGKQTMLPLSFSPTTKSSSSPILSPPGCRSNRVSVSTTHHLPVHSIVSSADSIMLVHYSVSKKAAAHYYIAV